MNTLLKSGLAMLALAFGLTASADDKPGREVGENDFLVQAIAADVTEVKMGERAVKSAQSEEVKRFAQKMIDDHTRNRDMLLEIAKDHKVAVVQGLEKDRQARVDQLAKLEGAEFDREYMRTMIEEHEKALKLYESGSKAAKDQRLRDLAAKTLPTIKAHLEEARKIADGLKK